MGYPLNGSDLSPERTPLEAGLGFFVCLNKGTAFCGQPVLEKQKEVGVPEKLAHSVALLVLTRAALDIVDVAAERKRDVIESARLYAKFNDELELHWLHNSAEDLDVSGRWQAQARSNLREEFYRLRRQLALRLITTRGKSDPREVAERWLKKHADQVTKYRKMLDEMRLREEIDFATLSVAAQELKWLISH